jgi:hypothetical protein
MILLGLIALVDGQGARVERRAAGGALVMKESSVVVTWR